MRVPVLLSALVGLAALALTIFLWRLQLKDTDRLALAIAAWAAAGGLISACFVVYGYLISQRSFIESQKPRVLLQVVNQHVTTSETHHRVHRTCIRYANKGAVECEHLNLWAAVNCEGRRYPLTGLFEGPYVLQVEDDRTRRFYTHAGLLTYGVPSDVVHKLALCQFIVGYRVRSLDGWIERHFVYAWNIDTGEWDIV